ncbi:superoxide dismutase family protein [Fulvivirga ligni]|uniref:superoxide dismutase family protein n=1 Tax=Fulvivirga ligni TaxID=2904246 RepID=UPI001F44107E|nr:superoxide dismutase family protein [Fulvivirga ligni]UII19744.1 superoxide dismutase family protein [Fulvivirga ligni]
MKKLKRSFWIAGVAFAAVACNPGNKEANDQDAEDTTMMEEEVVTESDMEEMKTATAEISAKSGSELAGTAKFTQTENGVEFEIMLENATPGEHAVHIHETGDCSAPDGKSAGGHWNPTGVEHGKRGSGQFHKGDIGNITIGEDGTGTLTITAEDWTIGGADDSNVVGHAIIVHAGPDDFTSQPAGAAGDRIGCALINADQ